MPIRAAVLGMLAGVCLGGCASTERYEAAAKITASDQGECQWFWSAGSSLEAVADRAEVYVEMDYYYSNEERGGYTSRAPCFPTGESSFTTSGGFRKGDSFLIEVKWFDEEGRMLATAKDTAVIR